MIPSSTNSRNDVATLFRVGAIGGLSDAELLARFISGRGDVASEAAFRLLVDRHGPMVLGVCRRVLGDLHSASDVFQATFLVLVRKAHLVRVEGSLGRWLYGVSHRIARKAKASAMAERARIQGLGPLDPPDETPTSDTTIQGELRLGIDEEIARLPIHYRSVVVLCYLEGLTQEQAARRLLCPVGTVESRLHRARERLRAGLTRRGLAPVVCGLAALSTAIAKAEVPTALASRTTASAARIAAGGSLAGTVSTEVVHLVDQTMRSTFMAKLALGSLGFMLAAIGLIIANIGQPSDAHLAPKQEPKTAAVRPAAKAPRKIEGTVLDPLGKPVAGATVVVALEDVADSNRKVLKTDENGRYVWLVPGGPISTFIAAYKEGLAPFARVDWISADTTASQMDLKLDVKEPVVAVVVDGNGQPVSGAKVRVEVFARTTQLTGKSTSTSYGYVHHECIAGSPLEDVFQATTDRKGTFTLGASPGSWLKLSVTTANGARMRVETEKKLEVPLDIRSSVEGFVPAWPAEPTRLVVSPAARIAGRVSSQMKGVSVEGLKISLQGSTPVGQASSQANIGARQIITGKNGDFLIDGLEDGTVNVFVDGKGEGDLWTYLAGQDVAVEHGKTTRLNIELIPGVKVEGTVVDKAGTPVEGVALGVYGPYRPRTGAATRTATTDTSGRYHYRLPPGETYFYVMGQGSNYVALPNEGSTQIVIIPEGRTLFSVPPIQVEGGVVLHGRVVDAKGEPVPFVTIVGVFHNRLVADGVNPAGISNANGEFRLKGQNHVAIPGQSTTLVVRLADDRELEIPIKPSSDGTVIVRLPEKEKE